MPTGEWEVIGGPWSMAAGKTVYAGEVVLKI